MGLLEDLLLDHGFLRVLRGLQRLFPGEVFLVPFSRIVRLSGHSLSSCHLLNLYSALAFVLKNPRILYGERLLADSHYQVFFLRLFYLEIILDEFSKRV